MWHGIMSRGLERGNSRAVSGYGVVTEWSAELHKSDEGCVRRAELARATPRSNPKSGETKRRVFGVFVVLTTLVSCVKLRSRIIPGHFRKFCIFLINILFGLRNSVC